MTESQRRLIRKAWWRFLALAFVGGAVVHVVALVGTRALIDGSSEWQRDVAGFVAFAVAFLIYYYAFREAVRALIYEQEAAQPASADDAAARRS